MNTDWLGLVERIYWVQMFGSAGPGGSQTGQRGAGRLWLCRP